MNAMWIEVLRKACESSSQAAVARRIGYTSPVVNQVLAGTYPGNLQRVQAAVEGALMNATVDCPVLGEISRAQCIAWQRRPFTPTNPLAVRMYRACRNCPHSFLPQDGAPNALPAAQPAVARNTGSDGVVLSRSRRASGRVTSPTGRRKRLPNPTHKERT